jgi:hypothetical protein
MADFDFEEVKGILEGFDRSKLADLVSLLETNGGAKLRRVRQPRDESNGNGKVIQYTAVTKHYTCMMCGYKFSATHNFSKGESVTKVDEKGQAQTTYISGKQESLEIHTHISHCINCPSAIKDWDRDKLEKTFITLLNRITIKEAVRLFE